MIVEQVERDAKQAMGEAGGNNCKTSFDKGNQANGNNYPAIRTC